MIFNIQGHIDMIRKGTKTQTRRLNRGCYQEGQDYAVHSKRGVKSESDIRIVMDDIWEENTYDRINASDGLPCNPHIFIEDARAEGLYTPEEYELEFRKVYPKWDGMKRWVFEFHTIEVQK